MGMIREFQRDYVFHFMLTLMVSWHLFPSSSYAQHPKPLASYNEMRTFQADIKQYPKQPHGVEPGEEITLGDTHGNALKLIYFLIDNGILSLSKAEYDLLAEIYYKAPADLRSFDIYQYNAIVAKAPVKSHARIRLLGDSLSDRGSNDYFTLKIYEKLALEKVNFEIVLSNHGAFFIETYERPEKSFGINPYGQEKYAHFVTSMLNLQKIIDAKLVKRSEVERIVEKYYIPRVQAIAYTPHFERKELTLYTHALVDLRLIHNLADDLNVAYDDYSIYGLIRTFRQINASVQAWLKAGTFRAHYEKLIEKHHALNQASPLKLLIWNRDIHGLNRVHRIPDREYTLNYVHGHHSQAHVFDLDTNFGKDALEDIGQYAIHLTRSNWPSP